jgi:hypothetical protein
MKCALHAILKFTAIMLAACCTLTSCRLGTIEIRLYRDRPKDPALIGEWFNLKALDEIKSNPELIENNRGGGGFLAGLIYHSNGDVQVIRLHYSKDSAEPRLVKEAPDEVFYTKKGIIYCISTYAKRGEYPICYYEPYMIKGNLLYRLSAIDDEWEPVYERKPVTVDLFPKKI